MENLDTSSKDLIVLYIISNVFLIRLNKHVLNNYECSFLNVSTLNTLFSLLGLIISLNRRLNSYKYKTFLRLIPTSICFCLSLICLNFSLTFNTFGIYLCLQCTATVLILISNIISTRRFNIIMFFSLISIACGYGLYLFYNLTLNYYDLNILAIIIGLIGGFINGLYLIVIFFFLNNLTIFNLIV